MCVYIFFGTSPTHGRKDFSVLRPRQHLAQGNDGGLKEYLQGSLYDKPTSSQNVYVWWLLVFVSLIIQFVFALSFLVQKMERILETRIVGECVKKNFQSCSFRNLCKSRKMSKITSMAEEKMYSKISVCFRQVLFTKEITFLSRHLKCMDF
jgi:hypothetical protein